MLDRLPDEIVYLVLKNFNTAEELETASRCCQKVRRVGLDNRLWGVLYDPILQDLNKNEIGDEEEIGKVQDYREEYYKQFQVDKQLRRLLKDSTAFTGTRIELAVEVSRYDRRAFRALNEGIAKRDNSNNNHELDELGGFLVQIKNGIIHTHAFQKMLRIKQHRSETNDIVDLMFALDKFWINDDCTVVKKLNFVANELKNEHIPVNLSLELKAKIVSLKLLQHRLISKEYSERWHGSFISAETEDASCLALACRFCYVARKLDWFETTPVLLFKTFVRITAKGETLYVDITRGGKLRTAGDIYELYRTLHIRPLPTAIQLQGSPLIKFCNYALVSTKMWLKRFPPEKRALALIGLVMVRNVFLTICDTTEQLQIQLLRALDRLPSGLKYEVAVLHNGVLHALCAYY